jgi:DNA-binding NarL/FixJ family response regulator
MEAEITILIADDHPVFLKGLKQIVEAEQGLRVIAEAQDGASAFDSIKQLRPAIAVLDVNMPKMDGFDVLRKIQSELLTEIAIIFLTMYKDEHIFNEAMDLGARGYILKSSALDDIVSSIQAVAAGEYYISPVLASYLLKRRERTGNLQKHKPSINDLTPMELRVLKLIAESKTSKAIAAELFISYRTVENHRANICQKLGLHGTNSLIKFALEHKSQIV